MKVWVVTGPIGSGKSSLSELLAGHGAAVIDADRLGHEVLNDPKIIKSLLAEFGPDCITNGQVDRPRLGAVVFSDASAMEKLNALIHPPLLALAGSRLEKLAKEGNHELAVLEAAVYFLWPPLDIVDMVVSVVAEDEIREQRIMASRQLTSLQASDRMLAQKNLAPFWKTADVVIDNSGDHQSLVEAVDTLLRENNL